MSLTTGEIIEGKYRIVRLIGEGGMGAVYEGENTRIRRRVAIKVLHQGVAENQEAVQRFEREAQAAGRIGNDHILEVLDLGTLTNGDHFMVMEYLDGEPLSERIRRVGRMRPEDISPLMIQALEGLKAAHDAGIVHRDLKPDNIFVLREKAGTRDFVKLIDFGISKFQPLGGSEMKMTRTGTVMGTPYYMSPEQASGSREADHRSDLYAVGVMLYEAVTGRVPFDAPTFNQLLFQIVLSDPAPPQQVVPDLDPGYANLIAKAMARDVDQRFQSATELSEALATWLKTGTSSVSAPPAVAMNPLVPRAALGSAPMLALGETPNRQPVHGTTTPDTWAASRLEAPAGVPKSKTPLFVGLAVAGLLVVGLGFGAYRMLAANSAASSPPVAASSLPTVEPTKDIAPATPSIDVVPATSAPSVAAVPSAAIPRAESASAKASPEAAAVASPSNPASAKAAVTAPSKTTGATASGSKSTATKSTKEKATTTKSATKPPSGPVDFGY